MRARCSVAALFSVGLLTALLPGAVLANQIVYVAELSGDAVVPGPGDPDGAGFVQISIDPDDGIICWLFNVDGIDAPTAASVRVGTEGSEGPIVASLGLPDGGEGDWSDCASGSDPAALQAIVDDPEGHYVDVTTAEFAGGALRGQLFAIETTQVAVFAYACPDAIDVEVDDLVVVCRPIAATGDVGEPPDGYTWLPEPIEGLDVELEEPDGLTRTLDEAHPTGGDGTCDPSTLTCWDVFGYGWDDVLAGETALTLLTAPDGYRLSFAFVVSDSASGPNREVVEVAGDRVVFDTTGLEDSASIYFVGVIDAPPVPTPTPTGGAAPTGGATPAVTPPATSTELPAEAAGAAVPWIALLLVVAALGSVVLHAPGRRR